MDKYTNYNGEDTYGNPQYDGYTGEEPYSNPGYEGYTQENSYNAPGYEGYTPDNSYNTPSYEGYSSDNSYNTSEQEGYDEDAYSNPNYEGVRLMDVAYNNTAYGTPAYNNNDFTNYEDNNPQTNSFEYDNVAYNDAPQENIDSGKPEATEDPLFSPLYPDGYAPVTNPDSVFHPTVEHNDYNKEELTEAELADIKRQKAAARRKKLAARERRRRERRKQAIIRCSILLAIVILLIVGLVMIISSIGKHFEEKKKARELSEYYATSEVTTEEPVANIDEAITAKEIPTDRAAALAILEPLAEDDSTMQSICDSAAALPDILLQHLAVNSELKDFTLSYPAMINIVFDGEFEVDVPEGEVPLFLQFDKSWGYADYSTDIIALRGAGPTALSMAYTYLKSDGTKNPIKVADFATEKGYLDENGKTHWTLMTEGAKELGLKSTEIDIDKEAMIEALEDDQLLICMVSKGDFTTDEHFIVIRDYKDGFFYVNDPNSAARSKVGWDFKRLRGQIEKMCALEAGTTEGGEPSSETSSEAGTGAEGQNTGNEDTTTGGDTTPAE